MQKELPQLVTSAAALPATSTPHNLLTPNMATSRVGRVAGSPLGLLTVFPRKPCAPCHHHYVSLRLTPQHRPHASISHGLRTATPPARSHIPTAKEEEHLETSESPIGERNSSPRVATKKTRTSHKTLACRNPRRASMRKSAGAV